MPLMAIFGRSDASTGILPILKNSKLVCKMLNISTLQIMCKEYAKNAEKVCKYKIYLYLCIGSRSASMVL